MGACVRVRGLYFDGMKTLFLLAALLAVGCQSARMQTTAGSLPTASRPVQVHDFSRDSLSLLPGMTREQVIEVCGLPVATETGTVYGPDHSRHLSIVWRYYGGHQAIFALTAGKLVLQGWR